MKPRLLGAPERIQVRPADLALSYGSLISLKRKKAESLSIVIEAIPPFLRLIYCLSMRSGRTGSFYPFHTIHRRRASSLPWSSENRTFHRDVPPLFS